MRKEINVLYRALQRTKNVNLIITIIGKLKYSKLVEEFLDDLILQQKTSHFCDFHIFSSVSQNFSKNTQPW